MKELPPSFFSRSAVAVAKELIGKILLVKGIKSRIVETEAYGRDAASHANKITERSRLMVETYGHIYVYLIYGIYHCLNITADKADAGAVLIRAVEPLSDFEELQSNRGIGRKAERKAKKITSLCSGPGKLCRALGIRQEHNGLKLGVEFKVMDDGLKVSIASSPRIGITKGKELPWRFYVKGSEFVSKSRIK
ncbi:MAG TPA: DNA-3-methyladenine glycosylase [Candidatus Nanoarchaeia archaeon]|nr:DNA-3-methyladenine glycosylase [Candidatus Nanoarchaeia archaeon]